MKMKNIETLVLSNMEQVDRYLSGMMSEEELVRFHERLEFDTELQEDLALAKEVLGYEASPWWASPVRRNGRPEEPDWVSAGLSGKMAVGRDVAGFGVAAVIVATMMVSVCLLVALLLR
jgi:hypothetical protein